MESGNEYRACAICARTMLRGESVYDYVTSEGETLPVCALCKARAEALGWMPAALAGSDAEAGARRRPRIEVLRERLAEINLRERFARPPRGDAGAETGLGGPVRSGPARRVSAEQRSLDAARARPEPEPEPSTPLDAFNASPEARKVSGLARSLGEPLISVRERDGAELITVAWELTWYQWEVAGSAVREIARGEEIAELDDVDRDWNASLDDRGGVRLGE